MDLQTYLRQRRGETGRLAALARVSGSFLSQVAAGRRPMPPERAVSIEEATGRVVRRWDLRPTDWHLIWPELIGAEGAPPVPAAAEDAHAA